MYHALMLKQTNCYETYVLFSHIFIALLPDRALEPPGNHRKPFLSLTWANLGLPA